MLRKLKGFLDVKRFILHLGDFLFCNSSLDLEVIGTGTTIPSPMTPRPCFLFKSFILLLPEVFASDLTSGSSPELYVDEPSSSAVNAAKTNLREALQSDSQAAEIRDYIDASLSEAY